MVADICSQAEKHKGTFLAPVGIGLSLFIAELGGTQALMIWESFSTDVLQAYIILAGL